MVLKVYGRLVTDDGSFTGHNHHHLARHHPCRRSERDLTQAPVDKQFNSEREARADRGASRRASRRRGREADARTGAQTKANDHSILTVRARSKTALGSISLRTFGRERVCV